MTEPGASEKRPLPTGHDEIDAIRWFHRIELAPGVVTPGLSDTPRQLRTIGLPSDLSGRTVLDVGAWDGFYAFEAERRGAQRVLATDSFAWDGSNWSNKDGFELARRALGSRVEDRDIDVMDLSPAEIGTFDVVLFLGVLYHLRHPLLALERVASVTHGQLILETHVDVVFARRPVMALYPGHELGLDPTNWWGPNPRAVMAMLRAVGFSRVELVTPNHLPYLAARAGRRLPRYLNHVVRHGRRPFEKLSQGRAVFHAFK